VADVIRGLLSTLLTFAAAMVAGAAHAEPCSPGRVAAGGAPLWVDLEGTGKLTVVFESGNGNDSSVWADVATRVRAFNVRTFVYDRAGLGKSALRPGPYSIDREVDALLAALNTCRVRGRIVVVCHSYGGFLSLRMAARDRKVAGLVLVDANVPAYFDDARTSAILAKYRPQYDALRQQAPDLAKSLIPLMEAYPSSARTLRATRVPANLPVIDIVAERSWMDAPEELRDWHAAHAAFDAQSPARETVQATGSGHYVMRDKPDLVVDAISRMIARVN
jgi:pimeloyl-ACP methyl ester carboxylesterase